MFPRIVVSPLTRLCHARRLDLVNATICRNLRPTHLTQTWGSIRHLCDIGIGQTGSPGRVSSNFACSGDSAGRYPMPDFSECWILSREARQNVPYIKLPS
jgi:hypothetical protein